MAAPLRLVALSFLCQVCRWFRQGIRLLLIVQRRRSGMDVLILNDLPGDAMRRWASGRAVVLRMAPASRRPPCGRPSLTRKARLQPAVPAPLFTVPRLPAIAKDAPTFRRVEGFHSQLTHQWPSLCEFLRRAVRSTIPVLKTRYWQATPPAPLFFSWSVASSPFAAKNSLRDGT